MDQTGRQGYTASYGDQVKHEVKHEREIADLKQRVTKLESEIRRLAGFITRALGVDGAS